MAHNIYNEGRVVQLRQYLKSVGYEFVPVVTNHKKCTRKEWPIRTFDPDDFDARHAATGVKLGSKQGEIVVLDTDTGHTPHAEKILNVVVEIAPGAPIRFRVNSARIALLYRAPVGGLRNRSVDLVEAEPETDEWGKAKHPKLEVLASGFLHVDGLRGGHPLQWVLPDGTEGIPPVDQLPELSAAQVDEIIDRLIDMGIVIQPSSAPPLPTHAASTSTGNLFVPPAPGGETFSIGLVERGLNALIAVKANLGNPGFENIVAGAINEARLNAPELVPAVCALLKAKLFHLPNWLSGTDEKRIASFASGNMPKDPKTIGSFIHEIEKHAPGWRSGPTVPPSAGNAASAPMRVQNVELFLVEKASKATDLIANADIPDPWGHPLVTPGVASLLSGGAGVGKGNLAIFLAGILGEAAPVAAPGAPPCKPTALDKFRPPSPTGFFGLLKEDAEGIAGARMKACQHRHGFSYDMAIFCAANCAGPFWFARQSREGTVYNPRLHEEIGKLAAEGFRVQLFDSAQLLAGDIINDNGAVAELFLRVNQAARDFDVAIIVITHLSKGSERSLRDRVKGASAWIDGARVHAFLSIMEPEEIAALGGNPLDPVDARRFVALELDKASNGVPGSREGFIVQTAPIDPLGLKRAPVLVPVGTLATIKADVAASTSAAAADPAVRAIVVRVVTAADAAGSPLSRSSPGHAANYGYTSAITAVAGELHIAHPDWPLTICENVAKEAIKQAATAGAIVEKSKSRRGVWGVP